MSERRDLTRWNRASLNRFRYVDGNAVDYLEILREQYVRRFRDAETGQCHWLKPAEQTPANEKEPAHESLLQRQQRLAQRQTRMLETYHQERRDLAWEIGRSFARACHILTEHSNAYANEGYLGTATQWDNVRRLVEMLDYHPAPPASAFTPLVFIARANSAGMLARGFQLKHSPPAGGAKVIFETLDDLYIDARLNQLRPKGWDQAEDSAIRTDEMSDTPPAVSERQYSALASGPAIDIQGVGEVWATVLNTVFSDRDFLIRDFPALEPRNPVVSAIGANRLRELKARGTVVSNFELEPGWSDLVDWDLIDIAAERPELLAEISGNAVDRVKVLQQRIELIGACLDQPVYARAKLRDLLAPPLNSGEARGVPTFWRAKRKPSVETGQPAMIFHAQQNQAEAATIGQIDEASDFIELLSSPLQFSWVAWPKSVARLRVAPRFQRKCWLNGLNVIRTRQPHGLTEGAFVCWKLQAEWQFAEILEADKMNLRLDLAGEPPVEDTPLHEAYPLDTEVMAATLEAIGLVSGDSPQVTEVGLAEAPEPLFSMKAPDPNDPSLPPLMPPGGLPFGSFLFPTPLLPVDLVKAAIEMMLGLGVMVIPSTGEVVFKSLPELPTVEGLFDLLDGKVDWRDDLTTVARQKEALGNMLQAPPGPPSVLFKQILDNLQEQGPLIAVPEAPAIKAVVASGLPRYVLDGRPEGIEPGDWLVGRFSDGLRALRLSMLNALNEEAKSTALHFAGLIGNEGELHKVYADFRGELVAEGADLNSAPLDDQIELEDLPETLQVGRDVLLLAAGKEPLAAKIRAIEGNSISTSPAASGFSKGELIICANVVLAGHGEGRPAKILGSGDATRSSQSFMLEVEQLSFTADASKTAGVAAAIEVEVAGRVWEEVSSLKDSAPGDHHYVIRMTEQAYVKIIFGDGEHGRRLPGGKNNIRVRYRVGSGLGGNVPPGGLVKAVNPDPLIEAVQQPVTAAGGGDMEDLLALRENAPSTLLALERAVSLSDFAQLARAQSSVWQARAYSQVLHGGRSESVQVVIVPAGGVQSTPLNEAIRAFLQSHTLPGVQVTVSAFEKQLFRLSVIIRLRVDEFLSAEVEKAVASSLRDHFSLQQRRLGEHLYLSEVYKLVEGIRGVENSICVLNENRALQLIMARSETAVVYLDSDDAAALSVITEAYQP